MHHRRAIFLLPLGSFTRRGVLALSQRGVIFFTRSWQLKVCPWSHERADPPVQSGSLVMVFLEASVFTDEIIFVLVFFSLVFVLTEEIN